MDEKGDAMKGREANRQTLGDMVDWTTSNSKTRGVAPERIMTSTGGGWCGCGDGACVCLPGMKGWGMGGGGRRKEGERLGREGFDKRIFMAVVAGR